jgi:diguanylate cyclase (GGDEF)-like protein
VFLNERMFSLVPEHQGARYLWDLFANDDAEYLRRLWRTSTQTESIEAVLKTNSYRTVKFLAQRVVAQSATTTIDTVVCTIEDLTDQIAGLKAMTELAHLDPITKLPNRLGIEAAWEQLSPDETAAVVFIDLDGFKSVNDTHGHAVGDEVLVEVGRRLLLGARSNDVIGRHGGDEFVAIIRGVGDPDDGVGILERLRTELCSPLVHSRGTWNAKASFGLTITRAEDSLADVIRRADEAMYREKQRRRKSAARPAVERGERLFIP